MNDVKVIYTDDQKAEALEVWQEVGTAEAERRTGIVGRTLIRWANEAGLMSRDAAQKTAEATEASQRVSNAWSDFRAQEALAAGAAANRMRREALEASTERNANLLKARVVAYGIFIDKAELLSGQATQRIQVWAESEIDRDLREAMIELEDRIRVQQA